MKLFIFTCVIAFILEDYGTFQAKLIKDCRPDELVLLFKTHALELVDAAAIAFHKNGEVMNGGSECVSGVSKAGNLNAVDAILAIMSIAKNYYDYLPIIRANTDVSAMGINADLMEHIRKILVVLERSPLDFDKSNMNLYSVPYLVKYKRDLSGAVARITKDAVLRLGLNCYQAIISICQGSNAAFFDKLSTGAGIVRNLMTKDNIESWQLLLWQLELNEIIGSISRYEVHTSTFNYSMTGFEDFLLSLGVN